MPLDIQNAVSNLDCVLCFETAADYLGINVMPSYRPYYEVYSLSQLGIDYINCHVVASYDGLDIMEVRGIKTTIDNQTIIDMLRHNRDAGVVCECLADWYYSHGETFEGLDIPDDIKKVFDDIKQDAIGYYNDGY